MKMIAETSITAAFLSSSKVQLAKNSGLLLFWYVSLSLFSNIYEHKYL